MTDTDRILPYRSGACCRLVTLALGLVLQLAMAMGTHAQVPAPVYHESLRPQFHFTSETDWINDPNGMVFYNGEYHLCFQRTRGSVNSGKKTWGHAISTDMLHWKQLPDAIPASDHEDIWSGSAVVDWNNTAGFQTGDEKVLVAMYTNAVAPFSQYLAYTNDRGRTWTKYAKNPVVPFINGQNRDPKVIWYEPTKRWVMALYLDRKNQYALLISPDLKTWTQLQTVIIPGADECPDFYPISLDNNPANTRWIFSGADDRYLVGTFDGKAFASDGQSQIVEYGPSCYAAQTFSDIPAADDRRIQIGWMRDGRYPKMPFNQQLSIPVQLTLRTTPDGPRVRKYPVKEVDGLHGKLREWNQAALTSGADLLGNFTGDLLDIQAELEVAADSKTTFNIRGHSVTYDAAKQALHSDQSAPLKPVDGKIKLRILVDRTSIETFGNDGEVLLSACILPDPDNHSIQLTASGGKVNAISLKIYEMKSVWKDLPQ